MPSTQLFSIFNILRFTGIGLLALLVLYMFQRPTPFTNHILPSASGHEDPCSNKQHCLIYYSAPWCAACQAVEGFVRASCDKVNAPQGAASTAGCKVIVGQGTPDQNLEMAKRLGNAAFLDNDSLMAQELGVRSFPHWYLTKDEQFIISRGGGLGRYAQKTELVEEGLQEFLGSSRYRLLIP